MATATAAILLAALAASGFVMLMDPAPFAAGAGLTLAAGAPLVYIAGQVIRRDGDRRHHPVLVSIVSGLGCIMVMAHEVRYGSTYQWVLPAALSALCIWMAWQRHFRHSGKS